ncbi:MAG: hypothetical protein R3F47_16995 [Gammaproteobacteria bacterium]
MIRLVVSGVLLVVFVILLGRCQLGNVGVGMGLTLHDTLSVIMGVQSDIERYHYANQRLPQNNRELGAPPPQQFNRKSPLIRDIEILRDGVVYIRLQAENKGRPVELVYRPKAESQYRLQWQCESFNITKEWRALLPQVCADAVAAFDRAAFVEPDTSEYLERVTREQREAAVINVEEITRPECEAALATPAFVQVTADTVALWSLGETPKPVLRVPRPATMHRTALLGRGDRLLAYADDRLHSADARNPQLTASTVAAFNTSRWRWQDNTLWLNSGPALLTIDLCDRSPRIATQYLMNLGAFNRISDFLLQDGRAYLSTQESVVGSPASALQITLLQSGRTAGFLKLDGKAQGLALNGRYLYVATGSYGIAVVDIFDATLPRLLRRVSTRDAAQDLLLLDGQLLVADRLGGLALFQLQDDQLQLVSRPSTTLTAEQLEWLGNGYVSVTAKDGTTSLWRWQHGVLTAVELR